MYYIIYSSDDTQQLFMYEDYIKNNPIDENVEKDIKQEHLCLICWSNENLNDPLFTIKEFENYIFTCNCNVLIHAHCLSEWIQKTNSCPICRKYIYNNEITIKTYSIVQIKIITYYLIFYKFTIGLLRLFSLLSALILFGYFFFIIIFNILFYMEY